MSVAWSNWLGYATSRSRGHLSYCSGGSGGSGGVLNRREGSLNLMIVA